MAVIAPTATILSQEEAVVKLLAPFLADSASWRVSPRATSVRLCRLLEQQGFIPAQGFSAPARDKAIELLAHALLTTAVLAADAQAVAVARALTRAGYLS